MKKIALVTGATSGIGEACARKFAENGYNVIITGRRADVLDKLAVELRGAGAEVLALAFDVRDREAAAAAISETPIIDLEAEQKPLSRACPPSGRRSTCWSTMQAVHGAWNPSTRATTMTGTR